MRNLLRWIGEFLCADAGLKQTDLIALLGCRTALRAVEAIRPRLARGARRRRTRDHNHAWHDRLAASWDARPW